MKKLPILLLSSLLLLGCVVGCGEETSSTPGGQTSDTNSTPAASNINSVTIQNPGVTEVVAGSTLKLTVYVDGPSGSKVTWESSDETVATVRNGTVTFKDVEEDKEVTITAISRDDSSKKDSLTFTVKDCVIDLTRSRGEVDALLFEEEGIYVQAGESALMYEEVYGTKWYVETTLTITDLLDSDDYPKVGLFSGTNEDGYWNGSSDTITNKNALFYVDSMLANKGSGWNVLNFVGQNDIFTDWDWNNQNGYISLSSEDKVKLNSEFTMGLLRNGVNYYLYAKKGASVICYKHVVYEAIAADEPSYAWLGGWAVGYNAKNFKAYVGDEVDALFAQPTEINLATNEQVLFVNDTYQLSVDLGAINIDHTKLSFESSDPDVATVTADGLVVAGANDGNATITVRYGELSAEFKVTVTSDPLYNVVLDGKMDDAIYSEQVRANAYHPRKLGAIDDKVTLYASRNSRGLYVFADYKSAENAVSAVNWWEGNNFEMTFTNSKGLLFNKFELSIGANDSNAVQHWVSLHAGTNQHNYSDGYLSDLVLNETTGLYEMTFEMFVAYEDLVYPDKTTLVKPDEVIGFGFGSPRDGWGNNAGYRNANLVTCPKITATGIYEGNIPETECYEHEYTDFVTTKPVSCVEDGSRTRTCKWCGHADTEVILSNGEHVWNMEDVTVTTPATCTTEGVGSVPCTANCGATKDDVVVAKDPHNHSGTYTDKKWSCCGNLIETVVDGDIKDWNSCLVTVDFVDSSQPWEVEFKLHNLRTANSTGWGDNFVAEVFSPSWQNGGWTFRSDWCGWGPWTDGGNASYTDINNGVWADKFDQAAMDMDVVINFAFDPEASTITVNMDYYSNVAPFNTEDKHLTYQVKNVSWRGLMTVAVGAFNSRVQITDAYVLKGVGNRIV